MSFDRWDYSGASCIGEQDAMQVGEQGTLGGLHMESTEEDKWVGPNLVCC